MQNFQIAHYTARKKLLESTEESGIHLDQDLDNDIKQILADSSEEINRCYHPQSFQHLFWDQQGKPVLYLINALRDGIL